MYGKYDEEKDQYHRLCKPDHQGPARGILLNTNGDKFTTEYPHRVSSLENLRIIRQEGMDAFLEQERKAWTCPRCGQPFSVHAVFARAAEENHSLRCIKENYSLEVGHMNYLYTRVSIRKYQDRPIEKEKTEAMLRAAMQAPSAANQQPWEFYVVTNKEKLYALSRVSPYAGMTKDAPAAIVSVYRKDCAIPAYAQIDLSITMENLWLETDAQGLGGVWLGIAPQEERMKAVEDVLGLPDTVRAFAIFPYGYPAEERRQQDRFDPSRIHYVE